MLDALTILGMIALVLIGIRAGSDIATSLYDWAYWRGRETAENENRPTKYQVDDLKERLTKLESKGR